MMRRIPFTSRHWLVCSLTLLVASIASGQGGGQNTGTGGGQGANNGVDMGSAIQDRLQDSDTVFNIDRGDSVGASAETVQGFSTVGGSGGAGATGAGGLGTGGFGGMGGLGGLGGLFGGAFNQFNQSQQGQTRAVRSRLRSAVRVAPVDPQQVQANLQQRIQTSPSASRFRGTNVVVEGRTATLAGQVGSEADQRMAQLLMRLEPGVSRVENQLDVVPRAPVGQPSNVVPMGQLRDVSPSDWNPLPSP